MPPRPTTFALGNRGVAQRRSSGSAATRPPRVPRTAPAARARNDSDNDSEDGGVAIDIRHSHPASQPHQSKPNESKKRKSLTSVDSDDDNDDDDNDDEEFINVEFGFWDPVPDDDLTFRALLKDLIPDHYHIPIKHGKEVLSNNIFTINDFCSLLSNQSMIGTTVKADGTEEPLGLLTVLPVSQHREAHCMKQLFHYCLANITDVDCKASFTSDWQGANTGLLISARLINTPHELIYPLHTALIDDIEYAVKEGELSKVFDKLIIVARCFTQPDQALAPSQSQSTKRRRQSASAQSAKETMWAYYRFEEELFERQSQWSARWPIKPQPVTSNEDGLPSVDTDDRLPQGAVLMSINFAEYREVVKQLQAYNNST